MNAKTLPFLKLAMILLLASRASAERTYSMSPGLNPSIYSSRLIDEFVKQHHPEARTHAFEDVIHFEHATGLHVLPAIVKDPNPPRVVVRGPLAGGVWCDIEIVEGSHDRIPAYSRAEGAIDRGAFVEHRHYVAPPLEKDHHLIVTVRLPKDAGEKGDEFVEGLCEALTKFVIERQTRMPSTR